ncbi:MAG: hypothetical protein WBH57_08000 [Anaerolineae bacterium]
MSVLSDLGKKSVSVESVAVEALEDKEVLSELLEGILSKKDVIRFDSFKVLLLISEEHPEALYPKWDFFEDLLDSDNNYLKYIAIYLIANLTRVDTENRFEQIFNEYYSILDDERTMTAAHLAANSGKIAKAKPKLRSKITNRLLNIDKAHRGKQKELIKGYAIEAFNGYFAEIKDKEKILEFVKKQLKSKSPRTRKKAREFLKKWEGRARI